MDARLARWFAVLAIVIKIPGALASDATALVTDSDEYFIIPDAIHYDLRLAPPSEVTAVALSSRLKSAWAVLLNIADPTVLVWNNTSRYITVTGQVDALMYYLVVAPRPRSDSRSVHQLRANFRDQFPYSRMLLPVEPAVDVDEHIFAFSDSVWAKKSLNIVPVLQPFWLAALAQYNVSVVGITVLPMHGNSRPESKPYDGETGPIQEQTVRLVYLISGSSSGKVDVDKARLRIRKLMAENLGAADIWTTPFQWSADTKAPSDVISATMTTVIQTTSTSVPTTTALPVMIDTANFSFVDSLIVSYTNEKQLAQVLDLHHSLWSFVFGIPLEQLAVRFINETAVLPIASMRDQPVVHRIVFEVHSVDRQNITASSVITNLEEDRKKLRKLLQLSSTGIETELSASQSDKSGSDSLISWTNVPFVELYEAAPKNLTFLANYVQLSYEEAIISNITKLDLRILTSLILQTWAELLVDEASPYRLAIDSWKENIPPLNHASSMNLSYTLQMVRRENISTDFDRLKPIFHEKMTNYTKVSGFALTFLPNPPNIFQVKAHREELDVFAVFDVVKLAYMTDSVSKSAIDTLQALWSRILGPEALKVSLDVYRTVAESSFSLSGDNGVPTNKLYFRILISCNSFNWNTTALRVKFREEIPSIRNASLLFSVVPLQDAVPVTTTTAAPLIVIDLGSPTTPNPPPTTATSAPDSSTTIKDVIVFCYPNDTERSRHLSALRQIWADALGLNIFDIRLNYLQDIILNSTVENSTSTVHQVTYTVVRSSSRDVDLVAAREKFLLLQRNSSDFNQENCAGSSSTASVEGSDVATRSLTKWNLLQDNGTSQYCSYLLHGSLWSSANHSTVIQKASSWTEPAIGGTRVLLTVMSGNISTPASFSAVVISENCSLPADTLQTQVSQQLTGSSLGFLNVTFSKPQSGNATTNVSDQNIPNEAGVYVALDSIRLASAPTGNSTEVLHALTAAWQDAAAWGDGPPDVKIDLLPRSESNLTASSDGVCILYAVRILTTKSDLNVQNVKRKFHDLVSLRGDLYGLHVAQREEPPKVTTPSTKAVSATEAPVQPRGASNEQRSFEITDIIILPYSSTAEREIGLEAVRKLWATALQADPASVVLSLKSETQLQNLTVSTSVVKRIYQLNYVVSYGTAGVKDQTEAKRMFDKYFSGVYGTFIPHNDAATESNGDGLPTPSSDPIAVAAKKQQAYTYLLYDELRLKYENATVRDQALQTFQYIWTDTIGSTQASLVKLVVYQESPPYLNDTLSSSIVHTIFYVIVIASDNQNLDLTSAKDSFQKRVYDSKIPFTVQVWNYSTAKNDPNSVAKNSSSSSNETTTRRSFRIVLLVSNNTALTSENIEKKFKETLLRISFAAVQQAVTPEPEKRTETSENEIKVMFQQSTRLSLVSADNQERFAEDLRHAWENALKPAIVNVTLHKGTFGALQPLASSGVILSPVEGQILHYIVAGTLVNGGGWNLTIGRHDFEKFADGISGVYRTTTAAPPANVLFP
ncbi:hypothetical protein BV898_14521 [Hypsibius exemplaris]|uniref:Uncharacterized protein n=1 Tax=Hypsibius exemplaris TaxID=2072580 RepID=A0A9X6N9K6_HYPEX|nr:hypothetical protein BV898_14521 [Hypsibius exemplaris]